MKVEIKMTETAKEPYAVIFTNEMTEAVRQAAAILEGAVSNKAITVTDNERIFVLRPEELYMLRVENERAAVYTRTKRLTAADGCMNLRICSELALCVFPSLYLSTYNTLSALSRLWAGL